MDLFWGNDLVDLKNELENKLLLKYLSDDEFRQNLSSKQSLIDQNIVINLPKDNLPSILNNRFFDFLKLNKLRYKI